MKYAKRQLIRQDGQYIARVTHVPPAMFVAWGLHLLILYGCIMAIFDNPTGVSVKKIVAGVLLLTSGVLFTFVSLKEIRDRHHFIYSHHLRFIFSLSILWGIITCLRSLSTDSQDLRTLVANPTMGWVWIIPLVLVCGSRCAIWKSLNKIFVLHICFGVVVTILLAIVNLDLAINFTRSDFGSFYCCGFLILTWPLQSRKIRYITLLATLMWLLGNTLFGQRVYILRIIYYLLASIFIFLISSNFSIKKLFRQVPLFVIIILCFFLSISLLMRFPLGQEKIAFLRNRMFIDSRSNVVDDFYGAVQGWDRVIGRGALGRFWSPYFRQIWDISERGISPERSVIECGYLQVVFKSGYVMLVLFLCLTVPAVLLGILSTRNILSTACGLIVLCRLVGMIPSLAPSFAPGYVVFWMSVGTCLNRDIRNLSNEEVKKLLA